MGELTTAELAERIANLGDLTCPLCGEGDFDAPGISMHWFRWCRVEKAIGAAGNNKEVAANLYAVEANPNG